MILHLVTDRRRLAPGAGVEAGLACLLEQARAAAAAGVDVIQVRERDLDGRTLTARELECLRWVSVGKTDSEIAVILSIKPRTARFHIENAKRKLGVATRVQAVAEAMRLQTIAA